MFQKTFQRKGEDYFYSFGLGNTNLLVIFRQKWRDIFLFSNMKDYLLGKTYMAGSHDFYIP